MLSDALTSGNSIYLRKIEASDFNTISKFEYSVSVVEPHSEPKRLADLHAKTGMWLEDSGAVAIVEKSTDRMIGTSQYYRSAPCIHGLEIGYIVHSADDRGKGYAAQALRLISDYLFEKKPKVFRHQLIIEVWNTASWKVAERCGFLREGILRSCGFGDEDPPDCFVYSRTQKDYDQAAIKS